MTSLSGVQADSSDGRAFTLSGPGTRLVAAGDVVVLTPEGAPSCLGQVTRALRDHEAAARGVLVGPVNPADGAPSGVRTTTSPAATRRVPGPDSMNARPSEDSALTSFSDVMPTTVVRPGAPRHACAAANLAPGASGPVPGSR